MALIALKCPNCNGDIQLDDSKEFGFCMYCGCKVMLEATATEVTLNDTARMEAYLSASRKFLDQGSMDEAYDYAKKVADMDVDNPEAWFIISQTTRSFTEKRAALKRAISLAKDESSREAYTEAYDTIKDKVILQVMTAGGVPGCKIYIDGDGGHSIAGGTEFEMIIDRGVHTFRLSATTSVSYLIARKREINEDCLAFVNQSQISGTYIEFSNL